MGSITFPGASNITSCSFGGEGLDDLYVTSAHVGDESGSNAGSLFRVRNLKSHKDGERVKGFKGRAFARDYLKKLM